MILELYLLIDDVQEGPFAFDEVQSRLTSGVYGPDLLAWWVGAPDWTPLATVPGLVARPTPPPPPVRRHPAVPAAAPAVPANSFYGSVGTSLLCSVLGMMISSLEVLSSWFLLIGLLMVSLGIYKGWRAYRMRSSIAHRMVLACLTLLVSVPFLLLTVGVKILGGASTPARHDGTLAALTAVHSVTMVQQAPNDSLPPSVMASGMLRGLEAIDMTDVDRDLTGHVQRLRSFLLRFQQTWHGIELEAQNVNQDAQAGTAVLGLLFAAVAANNNNRDPFSGFVEGGRFGSEVGEGVRQSNIQQILNQHQASLASLNGDWIALCAEDVQLSARYGRPPR